MQGRAKVLRAVAGGFAGLAAFLAAAEWSRSTGAHETERLAVKDSRPAAVVPAVAAPALRSAIETSLTPPPLPRPFPLSGEAFAKLSWLPPPPPPPPPAPAPPPARPAPPEAPPLPFAFIGMVEQGTVKPQAFLSRGDALLIVSAGDQLDNNIYRIDRLDASQVVITYLPLNIQQTIQVSGGSQ